jgi:hypothetical protein
MVRVPYLIYPEDKWKRLWELLIGLLLILSAILIPVSIAFNSHDPTDD